MSSDMLNYSVNHFYISHSLLEVQVLDQMYARTYSSIIFADTKYFSGPLRWVGSRFQQRSIDELANFMLKYNLFDIDHIEYAKYQYKLYISTSKHGQNINIVSLYYNENIDM